MGIDLNFMNKFMEEHPEPVGKEQSNGRHDQPGRNNTNHRGGHTGPIEEQDAFLECHHIEAGPRRQTDNGGTEREIPCPNGPHQASVYRYEDGTFGFKCFHTSNKCHEMHWADFAEMVEPGYRLKQEQAKLEELKTSVDTAMGKQDVPALYDLAEQVAQLPTKEQEILCTTIKNTMAKCKDFSWSGFKKLLSEAAPQRNVSRRTMGGETYLKTSKGMLLRTQWGQEQLSNFAASITADITTDDGAEKSRGYAICAELHGRQFDFEVKSSEFSSCAWVDQYIGARATIGVGQSSKGHLINAIKMCSEEMEEIQYYAHTGWRKIDGKMVFLHAGECLSQVSQVSEKKKMDLTNLSGFSKSASQAIVDDKNDDISQVSQVSQVNTHTKVKLTGTLKDYVLPLPVPGVNSDAVRASLRVMDLTTDTITVPLSSSIWRAVLGDANYAVHLVGESGMGKTELCVLIQQHFGTAWSNQHLPGNWASTDNSLEFLLFQAKDCVVVVDDFKPLGSKIDQDKLHAKADRIFRNVGNGSARGRLTANLEQRAERRPRGLLISTGEDVPKGQSLKARGVVLTMTESITKGEAKLRLDRAQEDGRAGLYAQAMASFIGWLTPRIEEIQAELPTLIAQERAALNVEGHARASTNTANMLIGMKFFLQFACETGCITQEESDAYLARCKRALLQVASIAAGENAQDKPTEQWKRHLITAVTSGHAYLADPAGDCPGLEYGWVKSVRTLEHDGITQQEETVRGGGIQIGWIDGDDIYLVPSAAYKAARAIGSANGDDLTTTESTLRKFLVQDGLLASTELGKKRNTITVRRSLQKLQRDVLHLQKNIFFPDAPIPEKLDLLDLVDLTPSEMASQAASENEKVSQVETVSQVDSDTSHLTNEKSEGPSHETDTTSSSETTMESNDINITISRLGLALNGVEKVFWKPANSQSYADKKTYLQRVREMLTSDNPAERAEAQAEVNRRLARS